MKSKLLALLLSVAFVFSALIPMTGNLYAAKADVLDQADEYFVEFLLSDTTFEGEIDFEHSVLYDEELNQWGREYTFTVGETIGFALMVEFNANGQAFYEIEELYYDAISPFANCLGLPVYISSRLYIDYYEGDFYNLQNDQVLSIEKVKQIAQQGFKYYGGSTSDDFVTYTQTVSYATKATTAVYSIQYDLPNYNGSTGISTCANKAGAVAIAYYDRFYEDLIPNYQVYVSMGPAMLYKSPSSEIYTLINTLAEYMLIGEPHEGTTFSEFQYGMERYVEEKGHTYSTTSCFTNGSFDFQKYKTSVHNNKPVAIFMMNYAMLGSIVVGDGMETIYSGYSSVSHVVVGCGYRTDTYYDANGNVLTTRNYLKVASGIINYGVAHMNINGITDIRNAISIQIS